jgi:hypothetical protein
MGNPASDFRHAKARVISDLLSTAEFRKGKELYRIRGDQIHLIDFQTNRGEYFINLGFHYTFLPSANAIINNDSAFSVERLEIPGTMLASRLDSNLHPAYPMRWKYEVPDLQRQVNQNVKDALAVFDTVSKRWRDPVYFVDLVTPDRFRSFSIAAPRGEHPSLGFDAGWRAPNWPDLPYYLALIAYRVGRYKEGREYQKILNEHSGDSRSDYIYGKLYKDVEVRIAT